MHGLFGKGGGRDQLSTQRWAGRFIEMWHQNLWKDAVLPIADPIEVTRPDVYLHLLSKRSGNDKDVRTGLRNLYGGDRLIDGLRCENCRKWRAEKRAGCPNCQGSGYEVAPHPVSMLKNSHLIAAMAVILVAAERIGK